MTSNPSRLFKRSICFYSHLCVRGDTFSYKMINMNLRFLFPPLRERWLTQSWYPWSGIWSFHSHLFVRGDNTIAQHFMSVDIRFNSHLCVRGDLEWFQILTTLSCFYSHLCTRGDQIPLKRIISLNGFYSHLCARGDVSNYIAYKHWFVSIHTSAREVNFIRKGYHV